MLGQRKRGRVSGLGRKEMQQLLLLGSDVFSAKRFLKIGNVWSVFGVLPAETLKVGGEKRWGRDMRAGHTCSLPPPTNTPTVRSIVCIKKRGWEFNVARGREVTLLEMRATREEHPATLKGEGTRGGGKVNRRDSWNRD